MKSVFASAVLVAVGLLASSAASADGWGICFEANPDEWGYPQRKDGVVVPRDFAGIFQVATDTPSDFTREPPSWAWVNVDDGTTVRLDVVDLVPNERWALVPRQPLPVGPAVLQRVSADGELFDVWYGHAMRMTVEERLAAPVEPVDVENVFVELRDPVGECRHRRWHVAIAPKPSQAFFVARFLFPGMPRPADADQAGLGADAWHRVETWDIDAVPFDRVVVGAYNEAGDFSGWSEPIPLQSGWRCACASTTTTAPWTLLFLAFVGLFRRKP